MIKSVQEYDFLKGEILLFDKPFEWTSFDLIKKIRNTLFRVLKVKNLKVGHAGTLDPLATGLMVVCTGKATKKIDSLQAEEKEYLATIRLGATTPSYDRETTVNAIFPTEHITRELLLSVLKQFEGITAQVPPLYSAVKIEGKRAYQHARNGSDVEIKPKSVIINSIELLAFNLPDVEIKVTCGKGTYIRALARDLGLALGSGAYLIALRRTRSGTFNVEDAYTVESFLEGVNSMVINNN